MGLFYNKCQRLTTRCKVSFVILGDLNEDLLNVNNHNLKNVLLVNSLKNIIIEPTTDGVLFWVQ